MTCSFLRRGLFSWNKNVPMAHIFNGTMDFPTRPGRNAQRGHYATVYFSLSRLEPWQHYIKAFICQEPSVEGPVERRRCSARRFYTSPPTRSVISASTSRLLNYNGNQLIRQILFLVPHFSARNSRYSRITRGTACLLSNRGPGAFPFHDARVPSRHPARAILP